MEKLKNGQNDIRLLRVNREKFQKLRTTWGSRGLFAKKLDIPESTIRSIEDEETAFKNVYWSTFRKLQKALGRSIANSLLADEDRQLVEDKDRQLGEHAEPDLFALFLNDKRKYFKGRDWLFEKIKAWLAEDGAQQVLLITGDPGVGKSAIVAKLVQNNVGVIAYHCCRWDRVATLDPWRFVCSIAEMLARQLPDYAKQYEVPAIRDMLSQATCQEPPDAFERMVLGKLPAHKEEVRYILIDGLDEATTLSKGSTIVDLLTSSIKYFPTWLRIVATTRKEPAVLKWFNHLSWQELKADDPQNIDDLKQYVRHRLSIESLQQELRRIAGKSKPVSTIDGVIERTVNALVKSSGGNFLYVRCALDEIQNSSKPAGLRTFSLERIDQFPAGLTRMYEAFFQRQFGAKAERYSKVKPIFEVSSAAREPLEEWVLATAAELDHGDTFRKRIYMLAQYLPAQTEEDEITKYKPFHKSLTDWLTDKMTRRESLFFISRPEGDRRLAKLSLNQFEDWTEGPPPDEYWVRHGISHLLRFIDYVHQLGKTTFSTDVQLKKYEDIVKAVDVLGWLNRFPKTKVIVAEALPLLSEILKQTKSDLDSPRKARVALPALERIDEQALFDLVKETCATTITEDAIGWIGRTQLDGWRKLIPQMLELNEYVVRYAAGCGQAARYTRLTKDDDEKTDAEKQIDVVKEIDTLLDSSFTNKEEMRCDEQEMGSYAVGEIAKLEVPSGITPQISRWLQRISDTDRYFCQSVLGDLLIDLTLQEEHLRVAELDESGVIAAFWNPIWQYTRLDVITVLSLRAVHGQRFLRNAIPFRAEMEREVAAIQSRERQIESFQAAAGIAGRKLPQILRKTDVVDSDNDKIIKWLTRDELESNDPDQRVRTAVEFLQLMFTHPTWQMCEKGAAVLQRLSGEPGWHETCGEILDRLIDSLDPVENDTDSSNWRVILGTCEACYLTRQIDSHVKIKEGCHIPKRFVSCCLKYYNHSNCHVRALLAEDFFFIVGENDTGKSGWETGRAAALLDYLTDAIDCWLLDWDVWVLEHVYQIFRLIDKQNHSKIDEQSDSKSPLQTWAQQRLDRAQGHPESLLECVSHAAGKPWVELDRAEFLDYLQAVRRQRPFPA